MTGPFRLGVDLGGTKIEAVVLDGAGEIIFRKRCPTPRKYEATLEAIVRLAGQAIAEIDAPATVGIGIPGCISERTGTVKNANSTWLIGRPFAQDLGAALKRPIRCENDANCLAVSEASDGAAAGAGVVFAAILGTGCGAGLAIAGKAHKGANGVGGEWGHNPLPWADPTDQLDTKCYCGKTQCLELYLSGTGLERDYESATGIQRSGREIHRLEREQDEEAIACFQRFESRLARGLASIINTVDPDVVVLGGGMSNVDRLYAKVPPLLSDFVFGGEVDTPIRRAKHGDSSGVRGAAWLWSPQEAAEQAY